MICVGQIAEFRTKTLLYPLYFYRKTRPAGIKKAFLEMGCLVGSNHNVPPFGFKRIFKIG
jgi:hypothetical protein